MTRLPFNPHLADTFPPPVMEARQWLDAVDIPHDRPLLNVSQAAPVAPPPEPLLKEMSRVVLEEPEAHLYGPVLGLPELRETIAKQWSKRYHGQIAAENVAITSGCNQAFCAAISSVAQAGDAVILPIPWYFNHKMWLDMMGIEARLLPCGHGMVPSPAEAAKMIDEKVKAIVLVTPNNPTGAEYPSGVIGEFANVASNHGIPLVLDETYLNFHSSEDAPHDLFADPDWGDTLIHLYSFSKVFRLTGHRIGAIIAHPDRLAQIEKFLDTMTICPSQIGQKAAHFGLAHLSDWVAGERTEILRRRAAIESGFNRLEGWTVLGTGAYFAYVEHPFSIPSDELARRLVEEQSVLCLPGTMFAPTLAEGGTGEAERQIRLAFANVDPAGISILLDRLAAFHP